MDNNHLQNPYTGQQTNPYMEQPMQGNPYAEQQPIQSTFYTGQQATIQDNPYAQQSMQTNSYMEQPVQTNNPYADQQPMQGNPYAEQQPMQQNAYAGQYTYTESWMNSTGKARNTAATGYTPYQQAPNYTGGQSYTPYQSYVPMAAGQTQSTGGQGLAIAGMICGILSILLCIFMVFDLVLAIPGLILSIAAIAKQNQGKGMAVAGLVCSIIGCLLSSILFIGVIMS